MNRRRLDPLRLSRRGSSALFVLLGCMRTAIAFTLKADGNGSRRWILRTIVQVSGGHRLVGLTHHGLAEARLKARTYRRIARAGGDPFSSETSISLAALLTSRPKVRVPAKRPEYCLRSYAVRVALVAHLSVRRLILVLSHESNGSSPAPG
jgi:hypothetical protein